MKTSLDIDDAKLRRLMKLTRIKTRKGAIDYALREAEKAARLRNLVREAAPGEDFRDAVDPAYDLLALRSKEKESRS